jgi:isocitrate lyase
VSYTYGCLDPVMVTQMAKYIDTVYVSGWQCSSTASSTDEPGPDLADYAYTTVPNKVGHLFMAQLFHDRKQREERLTTPKADRANAPSVDYLRPIIADADRNEEVRTHGWQSACPHQRAHQPARRDPRPGRHHG